MSSREYAGLPLISGHYGVTPKGALVSVVNTLTFDYPAHMHDYYEMELVVEGEGWHYVNGTCRLSTPGSFTLMTPNDVHSYRVIKKLRIYNIRLLDANCCEAVRGSLAGIEEARCIQLEPEETPHFKYAFERLGVLPENGTEVLRAVNPEDGRVNTTLLGSEPPEYALPLFASLVGYLKDATKAVKHVTGTSGAGNTARRVNEYIVKNFTHQIKLADVASYAYIHPCYLSGEFPKWFGCGFNEYVNRLRLGRAAALLTSTDVQVTSVAYESGFGSVSQFIRVFREVNGMTPAQYRASVPKR